MLTRPLILFAAIAGLICASPRAHGQVSIDQATERLHQRRIATALPHAGPERSAGPDIAAAAPSLPARAPTTDGAPLPDLDQAKVEFSLLPAAQALGAAPAALAPAPRFYCLAGGSRQAVALHDAIKTAVYGATQDHRPWEYAWYTTGLQGADAVGFDLTNGRVTRIGYYYKLLTPAKAAAALKQWARLDPASLGDQQSREITQNNVRLRCCVERRMSLPIFSDVDPAVAKAPGDAGLLVYEVLPADWYLLYHSVSSDVAAAMRRGGLLVGMDRAQALASMGRWPRTELTSTDGQSVLMSFYFPGSGDLLDFTARFDSDRLTAITHDDPDAMAHRPKLRPLSPAVNVSHTLMIPLPDPSLAQVYLDFDGTISRLDVLDELIVHYSRDNSWKDLEQQWQAGRIGSRQCLAGEFALLDITPAQLDAFLDQVRIDPHTSRLLDLLHHRRVSVSVLSDGIDFFIQRILARHGIHGLGVRSNALKLEHARWTLQCPWADASCTTAAAHCKCASMQALGKPGRRSIYVGDGHSDLCPARKADVVFAKDTLARKLAAEHIPFIPYTTLGDVTDTLTAAWAQSDSVAPIAAAAKTSLP